MFVIERSSDSRRDSVGAFFCSFQEFFAGLLWGFLTGWQWTSKISFWWFVEVTRTVELLSCLLWLFWLLQDGQKHSPLTLPTISGLVDSTLTSTASQNIIAKLFPMLISSSRGFNRKFVFSSDQVYTQIAVSAVQWNFSKAQLFWRGFCSRKTFDVEIVNSRWQPQARVNYNKSFASNYRRSAQTNPLGIPGNRWQFCGWQTRAFCRETPLYTRLMTPISSLPLNQLLQQESHSKWLRRAINSQNLFASHQPLSARSIRCRRFNRFQAAPK